MPPPLNPQGSRSGLITAVVVLSILFVTSAIFAFYYSAETNKAEVTLKNRDSQMAQFAPPDVQSDPAVAPLLELRNTDQNFQGQSILGILLAQKAQLTQANATLTGTTNQLSTRVKDLEAETAEKTEQLNAATEKLKQEIAARDKMKAEAQRAFNEQSKLLAEAVGKIDTTLTSGGQSVEKIQAAAKLGIETAQREASSFQQQIAARDKSIKELQDQLVVYKNKLEPLRLAIEETVVRQADGRIIRVPGNDNVFINLGVGDQISPGMTFEVYDRFAGVPSPGDEEAADATKELRQPKGKASIEVIRPSAGQSECRIVRMSSGQPVIEGDIVANLVYDKNTKYNFVVFGDFDLDQDEKPAPADTDIVRRLITQWGGRIQDEVQVNTDFVVLGTQPVVPLREENETATDIARRDEAERQLKAYNDLRSRAIDLNVPILNQNKFLYYIGYYERAQR
jgi:hypothetical protein